MRIFVKASHQVKEVANLSARKDLEENIEAERRKSSGLTVDGEKTVMGIQDRVQARKNLNMWEKTYQASCPETLTPGDKDRMWRRAKELKDDFTVGMLSKDELHPVKAFQVDGKINVVADEEKMRSIHSVEREKAWQAKNESKIREFKNIMKNLEPDDPRVSDTERFRPVGRIK